MASSQAWYEFNGASLATPSAVSGCYWKANTDTSTNDYVTNPVTAGSNSYSKIQSLLFSAGSSSANVYSLSYTISANGNANKQTINTASSSGTSVVVGSTSNFVVGTPVSAYNSSSSPYVNLLPSLVTSGNTSFLSGANSIGVPNGALFTAGSSIYVSNGSGANCFPNNARISSISGNTLNISANATSASPSSSYTIISLPAVVTVVNSTTLTLSQAPSGGWSNATTLVGDPTGNFWNVVANGSSIAASGYSAPITSALPGGSNTITMPTTGNTGTAGAWATAGSPNYAFGTANAGNSGSPIAISASGTLYTTALYTQLQTYVGASAGSIGSLTITASWTES
jgi:hypothetical protein